VCLLSQALARLNVSVGRAQGRPWKQCSTHQPFWPRQTPRSPNHPRDAHHLVAHRERLRCESRKHRLSHGSPGRITRFTHLERLKNTCYTLTRYDPLANGSSFPPPRLLHMCGGRRGGIRVRAIATLSLCVSVVGIGTGEGEFALERGATNLLVEASS
jgi:hypothetical protein